MRRRNHSDAHAILHETLQIQHHLQSHDSPTIRAGRTDVVAVEFGVGRLEIKLSRSVTCG
jgi:hypothetical protein